MVYADVKVSPRCPLKPGFFRWLERQRVAWNRRLSFETSERETRIDLEPECHSHAKSVSPFQVPGDSNQTETDEQ